MQLSNITSSIFLTAALILPGCSIYQKLTHTEQEIASDEATGIAGIISQVYIPENINALQQATNETPVQENNSQSLRQIRVRDEDILLDDDVPYFEQNYEPQTALQEEITLSLFDYGAIMDRFRAHLNANAEQIVDINLQNSRIRNFANIQNNTQYEIRMRGGYPRGSELGDEIEQEFMNNLFKETKRFMTKSLTDTLKEIEMYDAYIRPIFRFNIKQDAPVLSNALQSTREIREQSIADKILDQLTEMSFGLNFDVNMVNTQELNLQPYIEWMNALRLTYSSFSKTLQYKLAVRIKNLATGVSIETSQTLSRINKIAFNISCSIDKNSGIALNGSKSFYDRDEETEDDEFEAFLSYTIRF